MNDRKWIFLIPLILIVITVSLFAFLSKGAKEAKQKAIKSEVANWNWNNYPIPCKPFSLRRGSLDLAAWKEVKRAAQNLSKQMQQTLFRVEGKGIPIFVNPTRRCSTLTPGWIIRTPDFGEPTTRFDVHLCISMIREAKHYPGQDESIRIMGRLGVFGHVMHELLHPFMGDRIGHSHPRNGDGLMISKPRYLHIGPVVKGIFKRINKHCGRTK